MNNENRSNRTTRGLPFPRNFRTTLQNVFRNINHTFTTNHDSGQQSSQGRRDVVPPPLEPLNAVHGGHHTDAARTYSSSASTDPSTSSAPLPADIPIPPHSQFDSLPDNVGDFMPELHPVSDPSDESDTGIAMFNPVVSLQDIQPVGDRDDIWTDDEGDSPPLEPITGTRRARVDDDGDAARDRRHPSERVGGPLPGDATEQNDNMQQLPPASLFGALFGLAPEGNFFAGEAPPRHAQTGQGNVDPSPTGDNPAPGRAPHGVPILTAGFTLTIPLFGPLAASDDAWEDPERAKKLIAGLEAVPLGLVRRLERVGGALGGHAEDTNAEGSSSGCAICWDALLDGESDNFSGQQFAGVEAPLPSPSGMAMNVDTTTSSSHSRTCTPTSISPSSDAAKIISLPCAHVFHASCLLPWFTRAKKATCPTCRFNIDPENLTYTPPSTHTFNRAAPAQADNTVPNPLAAGPQTTAEAPSGAPSGGAHAADTVPPVQPTPAPAHAGPATAAVPPGLTLPIPQVGIPATGGPGFNPFRATPGIPIFSLPPIQIPLRPTVSQAPTGDSQGIDVMTIGLDMFVGGVPPEEGDRNPPPRDGAGNVDNSGADTTGGHGAENPNGLTQDLQSLIEGLLRTTQNIIPQMMNAQGPAPAPAPDSPVDGAQQQPQVPEAAGFPPAPPPGGPRGVPPFPFPMMFRPARSMPPRQERKVWTVPPAPGPSLRQRVEQREREQGLRCSDMSCGVGPSDDEPCPEPSASLMKRVPIHPLPDAGDHESGGRTSVCAHTFHPACLVSTVRVAGWGDDDKTEPLVEVSCPVCRAIGCVTREEWETGVSAM